MKITSTFQTNPIDIDKEQTMLVGIGDKVVRLKPSEYREYIKQNGENDTSNIEGNHEKLIEEKINLVNSGVDIPQEEWDEIILIRLPFPLLLNFSNKEFQSDIPIIAIAGNQKLDKFKEKKNKVICITPGVIIIKRLSFTSSPSLLSTIYGQLISQGIDVQIYRNDLLLNNKKFFGILGQNVGTDRLYEEVILTFHYDDLYFRNLPKEYYSRSYVEGNSDDTPGITGIINEYPDFDINQFLESILEKLKYI